MKLYYAPGACSLADHIALNEADIKFELVKVDLKTHKLEDGGSFRDINPKGYVPALELDDGEVLVQSQRSIVVWISSGELLGTQSSCQFALVESAVMIAVQPREQS